MNDALGDNHVWEIPLEQIRPAPWNPPSRLEPESVQDLAESIRIEGQQSPALVRLVEAELPVRYEIVWGHRRYAAQKLIAGNGGGPETTLKTFIREMTEEQAMISSGIENLQRQGFSDIEEAEFFRSCSERYGEVAVWVLAEKLSVSDKYIRKRLSFLELPQGALDLWRSGQWHVGHMEQLLRLGGTDAVTKFLNDNSGRSPEWPVWELKERIDRLAVPLHSGHFDKTDCKTCPKNTDVQRSLFGSEKEKTKCLDADCFGKKEKAWLDVNWLTCKENKWGTQAAICDDVYKIKTTGTFGKSYDKPAEKCLSCPKFVSIVGLGGYEKDRKFRVWIEMACRGDKKCFDGAIRQDKKKGKTTTPAGKGKATEPEAPRVAWHGEYFRQEFYRQEIPQLLEALGVDDPRRLQLALAAIVYSCRTIHAWFFEKFGRELAKEKWQDYGTASFNQILALTRSQNALQAELLMTEALAKIALQSGRSYETTFYDQDRQAIAEFLDIDFANYQVTEEYLEKKTKAELVRFIVHDSGLLEEPAFQKTMTAKSIASAEKLAQAKKGALVKLIQQCGVDLHGRLPKEIADRPKLEGK